MAENSKKDREILAEALERFTVARDSCSDQYTKSQFWLNFCDGEQWSDEERKRRGKRPCVTINRLGAPVKQVCNSQRQNRPMIKVFAVDNSTDPETAEVINGMLRHIQSDGGAESAVDTAFDYAVKGGIGYVRILTEYCDDESSDQEIRFKRINNPFQVVFPLHLCNELDFSDAPYAFVVSEMTKEEFEKQYGNTPQIDWEELPNSSKEWFTDDIVRVAEYFCVETTTKKLFQLADGSKVNELVDGALAVAERDVEVAKVLWYKLCGDRILERSEIPGRYIPIVPVIGQESLVDGNRVYRSLIADSVDPQRLYNAWRSNEAALVSKASRASWIAAVGQLENVKRIWERSNVEDIAVLEYNPVSAGGQVLGPPRQSDPMPVPTGLVNAARECADEIKMTTGVFDASMGAQGNESSGRAIIARQRQGDSANTHFSEHLLSTLRHIGRIIVAWIPYYYDTPRVVRIIGEDKVNQVIAINQMSGDGKVYDVTVGRYDVVVDTAPSAVSRRNEIGELLVKMAQADPVVMQAGRDLIARFIDMPTEVVERLARTIPKELKGESDKQSGEGQQEDMLKQLMQQAAQYEVTIKALDETIQKMAAELEALESKKEIEEKKIAAGIATTRMKIEGDIARTQIDNAHDAGMEAVGGVRQLNSEMLEQLAVAINNLDSRLGAVEGSVKGISAPAPAPFAEIE